MQNGKTEGLNDEQNTKMMCEYKTETRHANELVTKKTNKAEKQTNLTQTQK